MKAKLELALFDNVMLSKKRFQMFFWNLYIWLSDIKFECFTIFLKLVDHVIHQRSQYYLFKNTQLTFSQCRGSDVFSCLKDIYLDTTVMKHFPHLTST